jgi:chromosome segregation ATPase
MTEGKIHMTQSFDIIDEYFVSRWHKETYALIVEARTTIATLHNDVKEWKDQVAMYAERITEVTAERDAALQALALNIEKCVSLNNERDTARGRTAVLEKRIEVLHHNLKGAYAERDAAKETLADLLDEAFPKVKP